WLKRLYTSPADSPSGSGLRPATKSKKSAPSSAVRNAKVDVRNTGGFTDPCDWNGSYPCDTMSVSGCRGSPSAPFLSSLELLIVLVSAWVVADQDDHTETAWPVSRDDAAFITPCRQVHRQIAVPSPSL